MKEQSVGVGHAKAHLCELLDRVREEEVVVTITRYGRPVAKIVPVGLVPENGHLVNAQGWLADDDPFFDTLRAVVAARRRHRPRAIRREA